MLVHHSFSRARSFRENRNRVATDSIFIFTIEELATLINRKIELSLDTVVDMVRDMVLNTDAKRPDVLIQPLLPLPPDKLLIAPSLIHTANWELCLMRNWIQRHPDVYSRVIAQKKGSLATTFVTFTAPITLKLPMATFERFSFHLVTQI